MVSWSPISKYPFNVTNSFALLSYNFVVSISSILTTLLAYFGSSVTVLIFSTYSSFCISTPIKVSIPYSKNSQATPMVIEKQNATIATNSGDNFSCVIFSFNKYTKENPKLAHKKPFSVCNIVSKFLIFHKSY